MPYNFEKPLEVVTQVERKTTAQKNQIGKVSFIRIRLNR